MEIAFCQAKPSNALIAGRADLSVIYSFEVDENGRPIEITRIADKAGLEEEMQPCISNWTIRGLPEGTTATAIFRWEHGIGWVSLVIRGDKFYQKIYLTGERTFYTADDQ